MSRRRGKNSNHAPRLRGIRRGGSSSEEHTYIYYELRCKTPVTLVPFIANMKKLVQLVGLWTRRQVQKLKGDHNCLAVRCRHREIQRLNGLVVRLSQVGIVPDDAAGRRVYLGAPFSPHFTLTGFQDLRMRVERGEYGAAPERKGGGNGRSPRNTRRSGQLGVDVDALLKQFPFHHWEQYRPDARQGRADPRCEYRGPPDNINLMLLVVINVPVLCAPITCSQSERAWLHIYVATNEERTSAPVYTVLTDKYTFTLLPPDFYWRTVKWGVSKQLSSNHSIKRKQQCLETASPPNEFAKYSAVHTRRTQQEPVTRVEPEETECIAATHERVARQPLHTCCDVNFTTVFNWPILYPLFDWKHEAPEMGLCFIGYCMHERLFRHCICKYSVALSTSRDEETMSRGATCDPQRRVDDQVKYRRFTIEREREREDATSGVQFSRAIARAFGALCAMRRAVCPSRYYALSTRSAAAVTCMANVPLPSYPLSFCDLLTAMGVMSHSCVQHRFPERARFDYRNSCVFGFLCFSEITAGAPWNPHKVTADGASYADQLKTGRNRSRPEVFGKSWKTEIRLVGLRLERGSSQTHCLYKSHSRLPGPLELMERKHPITCIVLYRIGTRQMPSMKPTRARKLASLASKMASLDRKVLERRSPISARYSTDQLVAQPIGNMLQYATGAAANEQTAEALVYTGLWSLAYMSLNSRNFPIPNNRVQTIGSFYLAYDVPTLLANDAILAACAAGVSHGFVSLLYCQVSPVKTQDPFPKPRTANQRTSTLTTKNPPRRVVSVCVFLSTPWFYVNDSLLLYYFSLSCNIEFCHMITTVVLYSITREKFASSIACTLDSTVLCTNMPIPTAHWLSTFTVEDDNWTPRIGRKEVQCWDTEIGCVQPARSVFLILSLWAVRTRSPPTKANRAQYPAGQPNFRKCQSCQTIPLVDGSSRRSPVSPDPPFRHRSIFTPITLIGSQDLAVKNRPNLFTDSLRGQILFRRDWKNSQREENDAQNTWEKSLNFAFIGCCPTPGSYGIRNVFPCKSAIGSEACRAGLISCDPIAKRPDYSLLTKVNLVRFPAGSPSYFRMGKPCRTMLLVGGFPRGSPVSPALAFGRCSILTSINPYRPSGPRCGRGTGNAKCAHGLKECGDISGCLRHERGEVQQLTRNRHSSRKCLHEVATVWNEPARPSKTLRCYRLPATPSREVPTGCS
ncbi:hypothetical protein PR048_008768 [Dryococelus australis]|uniref:Uncharacterized protein n=1 Tax=Dryococelus australis TaxID=614101 RepID=A0ABQ9HZ28_9NEOP|nr:hypothetical protein PR048_008768 [Dryococelus australis]